MAIAKVRSSLPVRGYYVTTIFTGRVVQNSGGGFGLPRLGGLLNAQVEGLTGGSSATGRLAAQAPERLAVKHAQEIQQEEKDRLRQHQEWKQDVKETAKAEAEATKRGEAVSKQLADEARKAEEKPKEVPSTVEVVKDPVTNASRVTGKDNAAPEDLDDPKKLASAEKKTVEQQKAEKK